MSDRIPAVFINAAAGGDERWARIIWDRPLRQLGGFSPREYWDGEGVLAKVVRRQLVVRVLREQRADTPMPAPSNGNGKGNGGYAFTHDAGITVDGLPLGSPVPRNGRTRTLPNYRPRHQPMGTRKW